MALDPQTAAVNDQNLANMAQQLEAALRRPVGGGAPEPAKRVEPAMRPPAAKPAAPAPAAAAAQKQQPTHSIEQEMASLLGRPGKS